MIFLAPRDQRERRRCRHFRESKERSRFSTDIFISITNIGTTVVPFVLQPLVVQISHPLPRFYPVRPVPSTNSFRCPKMCWIYNLIFKFTKCKIIFKFCCKRSKNFIWYEKISASILIYNTEIFIVLICKNWQFVLRYDRLGVDSRKNHAYGCVSLFTSLKFCNFFMFLKQFCFGSLREKSYFLLRRKHKLTFFCVLYVFMSFFN